MLAMKRAGKKERTEKKNIFKKNCNNMSYYTYFHFKEGTFLVLIITAILHYS